MSSTYLPSTSSQRPIVSRCSSHNAPQLPIAAQVHLYCNSLNSIDCFDGSETCSDTSYHNSDEYECIKETKITDPMCSGSDKNCIRYHQHNGEVNGRLSNAYNSLNRKSIRKIYPAQDRIPTNLLAPPIPETMESPTHRLDVSQPQDRPQSSLSAVIMDGCGGDCNTFENVFYYFLQFALTMGILIGLSLTIAGAVLCKSATRNLQVFIYIGVILTLVSSLLLYIQCTARNNARKRKKAIQQKAKEPIPLVQIHSQVSSTVMHQQRQPLMDLNFSKQRTNQHSQRSRMSTYSTQLQQEGMPWWRRNDL